MLHFILSVSSHEESENILEDGQQCISKMHQKCNVLGEIDKVDRMVEESKQRIEANRSGSNHDMSD